MDLAKAEFVRAVLDRPIEGLMDLAPIRAKCDATVFREGLVCDCQETWVGIGNAQATFSTASATPSRPEPQPLSSPKSALATPTTSLPFDDAIDLSHWFDVERFLESWQLACPQIRAVVSEADLVDVFGDTLVPAKDALPLYPTRVWPFELLRGSTVVDITGGREGFDEWCVGQDACKNATAKRPVKVKQMRAAFIWQNWVDTPDFVRNFVKLFRLPKETRTLAASVLWAMQLLIDRPVLTSAIVYPEDFNGTSSSTSTNTASMFDAPSSPCHFFTRNAYFGAHLRVADDAKKAGWPGYEAQAPYYIKEASFRGLSHVFLVSGSPPHVEQFRQDAAAAGLVVKIKRDLLDRDELDELDQLDAMTWDRQGLVDLNMLMHSSYFYGFARSSFSWQIALCRGIMPGSGPRWLGWRLLSHDAFRDEVSAIAGNHPMALKTIWP